MHTTKIGVCKWKFRIANNKNHTAISIHHFLLYFNPILNAYDYMHHFIINYTNAVEKYIHNTIFSHLR